MYRYDTKFQIIFTNYKQCIINLAAARLLAYLDSFNPFINSSKHTTVCIRTQASDII